MVLDNQTGHSLLINIPFVYTMEVICTICTFLNLQYSLQVCEKMKKKKKKCYLMHAFHLSLFCIFATSWGTRRCTGKQKSENSVTSFHPGISSYLSVKSPLLFASFPLPPSHLPSPLPPPRLTLPVSPSLPTPPHSRPLPALYPSLFPHPSLPIAHLPLNMVVNMCRFQLLMK